MFKAKLENVNGDIITLTGNESVYQCYRIDGTNPPTANINTAQAAGKDGAVFNSSKLNMRNIVIYVKINGNAEANRLNLYNFARTKEWCRFYYENGSRNVSIDGYVESVAVSPFSMREIMQISILCPEPYFKGVDEILSDSSNVSPMFTFPFSIDADDPVVISELLSSEGIVISNTSDATTGAIIYLVFNSSASSVEIKNTTTGDDFKLVYSFQSGDIVEVNTNDGEKSIKLVRSGVVSNLMSAFQRGGTFPKLYSGVNIFDYLVDNATPTGQVDISFRYHNVYRGV